MASNFYNIVVSCHSNPKAREKCEESLQQLAKDLKEILKIDDKEITDDSNCSKTSSAANYDDDCSSNDVIKDPLRKIATKGRPKKTNTRIRSHFERRKTATSRPNEYGTLTPIQRLF